MAGDFGSLANGVPQRGADVAAGLDPPTRDNDRTAVTDPWRLIQKRWQPAHAARDETLFALSNGSIGVRGGIEESASPTHGTYIAGVWEKSPIHYHERHFGFARDTDTRIPVADATAIRIRLGDERVDPAIGECLEFRRELDFRHGKLLRRLVWRTSRGTVLEVNAERVVSLVHPGLVCIRWMLRSPDDVGELAIESSIDGGRIAAAQGDDPRFGAGGGLAMDVLHAAADANEAWIAQRTHASAIGVVCAQRHRIEHAGFSGADTHARGAMQVFTAKPRNGNSITIEKYIAYAWTRPHGTETDRQLHAGAQALLDTAMADDFDALAGTQARECAKFWNGASLSIDDDGAGGCRDEQALRFNLFHLFQAAGRDGTGGIAAKGLTGEGYEGHVFWDSETFVLPVLAFTAPALVKPSLVWRFNTLDRARAHAREMNHDRGALYPWRTIAGDECSSHYPSGSAQYHINAAVMFAIRLYVEATGDRAFLASMGAEIVVETARIWLQAGHFNPRRGGAFCIDAVTGPDEYTALVDNNYYTNRMAQEHLRYAADVMRELANDDPETHAELTQKLDLHASEIADWLRAADAMYLPRDERLGIIAQDDTFLDKPVWDFAATPANHYPLLLHYHPLTLYRHQVCKQADAVLALVLAGDDVDLATRRRSLDYYAAITVHDSTLSASTFAVLSADVGYVDKAQRYFHDALRVDLDDLQANTDHGVHLASMAGSWMAFAWGFGGLRVTREPVNGARLSFDPVLPPAWRGYRFSVVWQGRRLDVAVSGPNVRYTLCEGAPLQIFHAREPLALSFDRSVTRPLRTGTMAGPGQAKVRLPQPFKALVLDLDGVIADTAHLHHAAWKRLAGELGLPWSDAIGESLKGVDRLASLDIVLGTQAGNYTQAQKQELADRKNGYYRAAIEGFSARDMLPGVHAALLAARHAGLKLAMASASRSAGDLAERMGIADLFDCIVDASTIRHAKPDPEIFQRAAAALGVDPADCLGVEDAKAGIAAIKSAGMAALGIGDAQTLQQADAVLPDMKSFKLDDFVTPAATRK
jgi:alpha,alpha-trehalose phosphorylase